MKKCLFLLILSFALYTLFTSTKTLTYHCVLEKGRTIPVTLKWRVQDQKDSYSGYENNLAKAAVVLARNIYVSDKAIRRTIKKLGYSKIWIQADETKISKPVAAFAHQKRSGTNYYLIVIRGTASFKDFLTDLKASSDFFSQAADNTFAEFLDYLGKTMKKTEKKIKSEKNVFFVVGHSMGGAVANLLSLGLQEYAKKDRIFTYTFESPSTGIFGKDASLSNSINIVNESDFVPDIPFPEGRYGTDIRFRPEELDPELYQSITEEKLDTIIGFTIINKWNNHLLDTSLTYVLSRDQGLLRNYATQASLAGSSLGKPGRMSC